MFTDPDETMTEGSEAQPKIEEDIFNLNSITENEPVIKGSVLLSGSIVGGSSQWDFKGKQESVSVYFSMLSEVSLNVRPTNNLRFFLSLDLSFDESEFSFIPPQLSEIFVDYTLLETAFFRIGKQIITWGQGLLIYNSGPGNFFPDVTNISLKLFLPLGSNGLTFVVYPEETKTIDKAASANTNDEMKMISSNPLDFNYSALFETRLGPLVIGISSSLQRSRTYDLIADVYIKAFISGVNLTLEARSDFDTIYNNKDDYLWPTVWAMANIFWESDTGIRLIGEYSFKYGPNVLIHTSQEATRWADSGEHVAGAGLLFTNLFSTNWTLGLQWLHHFNEHSGQIIVGATGTIAPNLQANFGIPIIYGPDFAYFARSNEDPEKRVIALAVEFTLSIRF